MGAAKFAVLPVEWIPLINNLRALKTFWALVSFAGGQSRCFPSNATLSKMTGIDVRHIRRALRYLEEIGAIKTLSTGSGTQTSEYEIMQVPRAESAPGGGPNQPPPPRANTAPQSNQVKKPFNRPGREGAKAPTNDEDEPTPEQAAANIARLKAMFGPVASAMMARKGA